MHVLALGDLPVFTGGKKNLGNILTRFGIGGLLFHNWEEYGKSKT